MKGKIYVLDTNVLIDYPDIIPNGHSFEPIEPNINLNGAHLVIPEFVMKELSKFKREKNNRGHATREVSRRIRAITEPENHSFRSLEDFYNLRVAIPIRDGAQFLSIFPVRKNFSDQIAFSPTEDDGDGQIILATLAISDLVAKKSHPKIKYDGEFFKVKHGNEPLDVILLTNDNNLASRANTYGIKTSRYSYKLRPPYTGRRKVCVPRDLILRFITDNSNVIKKSEWDALVPSDTDLSANEFIVMYPDEYSEEERGDIIHSFRNVGRYDKKKNCIVHLEHHNHLAPVFPKNIGQAIYIEALMNPEISAVVCSGPAGSGKTFLAAIYAYQACKIGRYFGINVVPCSSDNDDVGFLPGDLNEKLNPAVAPIKNALHNYLLQSDEKFKDAISRSRKGNYPSLGKEDHKSLKERVNEQVELIWKNWFGEPIPIAYARGRDFAYEIALYDEFQDQSRIQADTLLKRLGKDGKIIITGDIGQIHSPYLDGENNGLTYARNLLRDNPYVAQITFTEDEVIRHPLVQEIVTRQTKTE